MVTQETLEKLVASPELVTKKWRDFTFDDCTQLLRDFELEHRDLDVPAEI